VSLTDPEARHGHKTRSESFWGHKINVLGDIRSSVVAAVSVTAGNGHDAAPGHALVAEAQRMRVEIRRVLADTAYGGIESRLRLRSLGVELVAPPPGNTREGEMFSKNDFAVDFERGVATCPNGVATSEWELTRSAEPMTAFKWPGTVCAACPLRQRCIRTPTPRASKNSKPLGRSTASDRWANGSVPSSSGTVRGWRGHAAVRRPICRSTSSRSR
jgi:Transposase DDE domain